VACVARARATASVCRAIRLLARASAPAMLPAAIRRTTAAGVSPFADRPAMAQALAIIRNGVVLAFALTPTLRPPVPAASAQVARAEAVALAALAEPPRAGQAGVVAQVGLAA
jgi:hypothetical protein